MNDERVAPFEPNRRWFTKALTGSAALAVLPVPAFSFQVAGGAFRIDTAPGTAVHVTSGEERFALTVLSGGEEREQHRVTAASIHSVRSSHFSVARIEAPRAA